MKKNIINIQHLSSLEKKILRKKKKVLPQSTEIKQQFDKKNQVEISVHHRIIAKLKIGRGEQLKQVKSMIIEKMNELKINIDNLIGFETCPQNYVLDYKISKEIGQLQQSIKLNCIFSEKQQQLQGMKKYKVCRCLATGGFSKVFLVRSKINGKFYAAKFIDRTKSSIISNSLLDYEKQISLKLDSIFLVKTYQFIENQQFFIFIMDYCPGGQLFYLLKQIRRMTQDEARVYFIQILLGIEYIHSMGYMYRDLKPENILLDAHGYIKIADFGLSKPRNKKSYSFCGSVEYMAPEVIEGRGHTSNVDYYCLGTILFEMVLGYPPFYNARSSVEETKTRILLDNVQFPKHIKFSEELKDFIYKLTEKNQKQRLGYFGGCKQIMCHPWLGKIKRTIYQQHDFKPPFPVNLNKLNFDQSEIGQSQRIFENRIREVQKSMQKPYVKNNQIMGYWDEKYKSRSHNNSQNKRNKIQYKSKYNSFSNCSNEKSRKSPYAFIIKNVKSLRNFNIIGNLKKMQNMNENSFHPLKWVQQYSKENKVEGVLNKLKKRYKNIPFKTTTQPNVQYCLQSIEQVKKKNKIFSPYNS